LHDSFGIIDGADPKIPRVGDGNWLAASCACRWQTAAGKRKRGNPRGNDK
jgi:hypothetical protein